MAKVLLFSHDVVGSSMAGPGIRYWEFAKALAARHDVTLAAPNVADIPTPGFAVRSFKEEGIAEVVEGYDVIITQLVHPPMARQARRRGTRLILDLYDPTLLEAYEIFDGDRSPRARAKLRRQASNLRLSLLAADAVLCASEKQRDLWIGALMAMKSLSEEHRRDSSLRQLIDVVPFGTGDEDPVRTGEGFRAKLGIAPDDRVLIWGGGVWNWFDPLTAIRAVDKLSRTRDDVRLVFMGVEHPNPAVPSMAMTQRAVALSKELGLYDSHVFFNFGWVPYAERQNHLLEADIGLSTHFDHVETRFSFRTRVLDYLWCRLPVVATEGDSMADLIREHDLGRVVGYEDADGLASAAAGLLDDAGATDEVKANIERIRERYRWRLVVEPVNRLIDTHLARPTRRSTAQELLSLAELHLATVEDIRAEQGARSMVRKMAGRAIGAVARRR